jgi:hypothetical protein
MKQYIINHFHIRGNYIAGNHTDIHDNPHAVIHVPSDIQPADTDSVIPAEGHYVDLVRWLDVQKAKGNDYYAEANFNRSQLCRNLSGIIGWEPDQGSLRKAQNR